MFMVITLGYFLGYEEEEDDNRGLGFYFNQKEEDEICVLRLEKEEDDNRDQFEHFVICHGPIYPAICQVGTNGPSQPLNGPCVHFFLV